MTTWIEVQTTDVVGNPVAAGSVEMALDGSSQYQALTDATSGPGKIGQITGAKQIALRIKKDGYWDVEQQVDFKDSQPPEVEPTSSAATYNPYDYEINADPPVVHSAADNPALPASPGEWLLTIHVRLSHIRDAEKKVKEVLEHAHTPGWFFPPVTKPPVWVVDGWAKHFETALDFDLQRESSTRLVKRWALGPAGAVGSDRLATDVTLGSPGGTMYFFERTTVPKLILVWRPDNVTLEDLWYEQMPVPLNYHIFFHPFVPALPDGWADHMPGEEDYPWNFDSFNLPHRYLMGRPAALNDPPIDQFGILKGWNKEKHMLHQAAQAAAGYILVFPVGSSVHWMGKEITTQAGALLLLQEINHFLQRRAAAELAAHPIGSIGISGFSAGNRGWAELATAKVVSDFDNQWDEIYNFDGNEDWFLQAARSWFHARPDKRKLRIYSQSDMWSSIWSRPPFSTGQIDQRFGAEEFSSTGGNILFVPFGFWNSAFGTNDWNGMHQVIPALFLHHALVNHFLFS